MPAGGPVHLIGFVLQRPPGDQLAINLGAMRMSTALKKEPAMTQAARLTLTGKELEVPVVVGPEEEHVVDITKLGGETGDITLDDGYMNTGSTLSSITFLDGEKGILR